MNASRLWTPPNSLAIFFVSAIGWFFVCTLLWMPIAKWASYPVASLTHLVLEQGAPYWVRSVQKTPGHIEVDTRIRVPLAAGNAAQGVAELVAEADPAHYTYGFPLFAALLLAARSRQLFKKLLLGYAVLWLPQTFSLVFEILRQIMVAGGRPGALHIDQWQMEGIALGYQVGSLLLPTLAPVALWLRLDRTFFAAVILDGWIKRTMKT